MQKIDFKKEQKELYKASAKEPVLVDVPEMLFLMIDGQGDPNTSQEFKDAVEALYPVAYNIKFKIKKGGMGIDYGVMPLEGLWWTDNMNDFSINNKDIWKWTLKIRQPDFITKDHYETAVKEVKEKKDPPSLSKIRFEKYTDGLSAQILHIGPYSEEGPTIAKLHSFIKDKGFSRRSKHREIYLSDMRRTAPEKLKTIIRQPVGK